MDLATILGLAAALLLAWLGAMAVTLVALYVLIRLDRWRDR